MNSQPTPRLRRLYNFVGFFRHNHELVSSIATAISAIIAAGAFISQWQQGVIVQEQLAAQHEQNKLQKQQFSTSRQTELIRIVFDKESHRTLKGYAVRELLNVSLGGFGKNYNEQEYYQKRWMDVSTKGDIEGQKSELVHLTRWRCEKHYDNGGGSGETIVNMLDLRGADLSGIDLSNESIHCVDFSGANLSNANLTLLLHQADRVAVTRI